MRRSISCVYGITVSELHIITKLSHDDQNDVITMLKLWGS